ncbi:hypothetical protein Tco_1365311, partial [Tanacetum coccineum]
MFYTSSYTKGWMSFIKRSDAAPVCHSKPLDSVKNCNDHFFWVDSMAFHLFVSLKSKILSKDPLSSFLNMIQKHVTSCVPIPPHSGNFQNLSYAGLFSFTMFAEMDLFAFIRHSDTTKVRIGEREPAEREVKLLKLTEGRTVSFNPPVLAVSGDSGDSIDKLFDEGNDDVPKETVAKDVSEVVAEKSKKKQKRKVVGDASGSTFPPKRL